MDNKKVISNAAWIIACRIIQSVLGMIIGMFTARYLGPANYGTINYAASLTAFALPFMQLGLNSILVQEIINRPEEEGKTSGTSIILCVCSAGLSIAGITIFCFIANPHEKETIIVCVLYSTILIFQAIEMLRYWFQAKLLSKYTSVTSLIAYLIVSVYKILLLVLEKNIYWFAFSNAFDSVLIAILLLLIYKKVGGQKLTFSLAIAKNMLKRGRYFIISSLMITIFAQTDKIMLKLLLDETITGFYSAAVTCSSYSGFVFVAILDSARPGIFESRKRDLQAYRKRIVQLYSIIIYVSLLQCVLMTCFSQTVIKILYGEQYLSAASVLKLVVWYTTFSYIGGVRSIWILAENQQRYLWIINLCGAGMNMILNACLIPFYGMYGAAFASIVTQIFTNVILGYIIKPIRENNKLLIQGINPKQVIGFVRGLKGR